MITTEQIIEEASIPRMLASILADTNPSVAEDLYAAGFLVQTNEASMALAVSVVLARLDDSLDTEMSEAEVRLFEMLEAGVVALRGLL
jgi:hypothetical protein